MKIFNKIFLIILFVSTKIMFSWSGSLWYDTHRYITKEVYKSNLLLPSEYPDLYKYQVLIEDESNSEAAHEFNLSNGGKVSDLWYDGCTDKTKGGVIKNYENFRIEEAYKNIARLCHLIQDQGVPAHVANIQHGPYSYPGFPIGHLDEVEDHADDKFYEFNLVHEDGYNETYTPFKYYQILQDKSRSKLDSWRHVGTGDDFGILYPKYWIPSRMSQFMTDATNAAEGDTTFSGHYGGR